MQYLITVSQNAGPKDQMACLKDVWEIKFDGNCHKWDATLLFRQLAEKFPRVRMFRGKRIGRLVMEQ